MKCQKDHLLIEWTDKDLFTCPLCLSIQVNDNLRRVREMQEKALARIISEAETALRYNR